MKIITKNKTTIAILTSLALLTCFPSNSLIAQDSSSNEDMAFELTALFRAYRATITLDKKRIHEPDTYFTKQNIDQRIIDMHEEVKLKYKAMTGKEYPTDRSSFKGSIRIDLERSFEKVLRYYVSGKLNLDWKGDNEFVNKWDGKMLPARFASYAASYFNDKSEGLISIKLTTSDQLLVNEDNKPDEWENTVINAMINETENTNKSFVSEVVDDQYRFIMPEYYGQGCIQCHGTANGEYGYDIHPSRIQRKVSDLAGAISIVIEE